MKKTARTVSVLLGAALLVGGLTTPPAEAVAKPSQLNVYFMPINFVFDGKDLTPPQGQQAFLFQDTTYVPIRFVSYALNKNVGWDGRTYTVTISEPQTESDKTVIRDYNLNRLVSNPTRVALDRSKLKTTAIQAYPTKVNYYFDGTKKDPDPNKAGIIYNNSLYVPVRFLSESVGKTIDFDIKTFTITASSFAKPVGETPAAGATPPPTAPIGGGSGVAAKPSYESIVADATSQANALKSTAEATFTNMAIRYMAASAADKPAIRSEGIEYLQTVKQQFEVIMSELTSKLTANGYSTSIVQEFRKQFELEQESHK